MNLDTATGFATWGLYVLLEQHKAYRASWWVHAICIIFSILILKFIPDMDIRIRIFIVVILSWHVVDVLTNAIDDGLKNDEQSKCTFTASISSDAEIAENVPRPSSPEKVSTSSSSERPMDESKPLETSTLPPLNTGAQ